MKTPFEASSTKVFEVAASASAKVKPIFNFSVIVLKVGAVVLSICVFGYIVLLLLPSLDSQPNFRDFRLKPIVTEPPSEETGLDELPELKLNAPTILSDAFAIANDYLSSIEQGLHNSTTDFGSAHRFAKKAREHRTVFVEKYGGETPARYLIQESIKTLMKSDGIQSNQTLPWVQLFLRAQEKNKLTIAFIGQSTTAGYGNQHAQSFPFVLERVLQPLLKELEIDLTVRNHAIEHIGPFPYTWCLSEYIGSDVDLISWDFGPTTPQDLEIWIRAIMALEHKPMVLFRDSFAAGGRHKIIQEYVNTNLLEGPTIFDWEGAVKPFLQVKVSKRPVGFVNWDDFGGPPGIQALQGEKEEHNWTFRQHDLVGEILGMWLLGHIESMVAVQLGALELPKTRENLPLHTPLFATSSQLRQPYSDLLYFTSPSQLSCYTTFDPAISGHMNGIASGTISAPLLEPKGAIFYNSGWVLDLEPSERKEKLLTREWDHLGMIDSQKSFYGVQASGTLGMRLELSEGYLELLVLCESQSPPQSESCVLGNDVEVTVGGEVALMLHRIDSDAVSYNGKRLCYFVDIPEGIKSKKGDVELEIKVISSLVTWTKGACSISHVIWKATHNLPKV